MERRRALHIRFANNPKNGDEMIDKKLAGSKSVRLAWLLGGVALYAGTATSAMAQQAPDITSVEEITVTAQKREQSVIDVPISMSVFGARELEQRRVQKVEDVLLVTPGVQYAETSDFLKTISIRGINDSAGGLFQTAGVTIDDATLVATYNGFLLASRLFDVERIEVLRGPQGALTGSNSTSGSINIITKKPKLNAFEAEAMIDYGRFDTLVARGIVNLPLHDTLAVRAVGYSETSDGSLTNSAAGGGGSTENHIGGRIAARWEPLDRLTVDLALSYEKQKYGAPNSLTIDAPGWDDPANADQPWAQVYHRNIQALTMAGGNYADAVFLTDTKLNGGTFASDLRQFTRHAIWNGSVNVGYEGDHHDVKLIYSHYDHDVQTLFDEDRSEFALISSAWNGGPEANYGELRLGSKYSGPFNWVAGASYMKERRVMDLKYQLTAAALPTYFGIGDISAVDPYTAPYFDYFWEQVLEQIESKALFANMFWDVLSGVHLSAGGRLSFVKSATQSVSDLTGNFGPLDNPVRASETRFDPRIALNVDLSENLTAYIQYATGFRAGYGNTGTGVSQGYGPEQVKGEELKNYEAGLKGRLPGGGGSFAASVFYMDYSNMQVEQVIVDPDTFLEIRYDDNVNSAKAYGFEIEGVWRPLRQLSLSGGISYVKSTIDSIAYEGQTYSDVAFPRVSPWTIDLSATHTQPISDKLELVTRVDYSHRDSSNAAFPWTGLGPVGTLPAYDLVDLSVGVEHDRWSVTAYIDNLFDEVYWQGAQLSYSTRGAVVPYNARSFGIRLRGRL